MKGFSLPAEIPSLYKQKLNCICCYLRRQTLKIKWFYIFQLALADWDDSEIIFPTRQHKLINSILLFALKIHEDAGEVCYRKLLWLLSHLQRDFPSSQPSKDLRLKAYLFQINLENGAETKANLVEGKGEQEQK